MGQLQLCGWCLLWCGVVLVGVCAKQDLQSMFYTEQTKELVRVDNNARDILMTLTHTNSSSFASYKSYLFGTFNMQIKFVPNDSAGAVAAFYMSSVGKTGDELQFELFGNASGQPYAIQTNIFTSGVGGREQHTKLWFDPTAQFHNYSFLWNPNLIIFSVDQQPVRIYPNLEAMAGVPYLHDRSLFVKARIYEGEWDAEGDKVQINWSHEPFVAKYRDFTFDACNSSGCATTKPWRQETYQAFLEDSTQVSSLRRIQQTLMYYDYCVDSKKYPTPPPECIYTRIANLASMAPSPAPPLQTSSSADSSASPFAPSQSPSSPTYFTGWIFHFLVVAAINFELC